MNCPLCIDQTLDVTHRNGIELDICPRCRGIWLDRGEIDRLIAEDETPPPPPAPPAPTSRSFRRDDDNDDDDRRRSKSKKKRKKKSLADRIGDAFEEVFDELT